MGTITNPFAPGGGKDENKNASVDAVVEDDAAVEDAVQEEPVNEPPAEEVPAGTSKEVIEWVGDNKDRARRALDVEEAKSDGGRKGLKRDLSEMLEN